MTYRTRQEIFDIAYRGLASQGFERSLNDGGYCRYRGDNGLKCAIGHCIDDADYTSNMEGSSITWNPQAARAARVAPDDESFVMNLQGCHDDEKKPGRMKTRLHTFAKRYNLTIPLLP